MSCRWTNSVAKNGTETVIVRLFNTYGPGEPFSDYRAWSAGSFIGRCTPTVTVFSSTSCLTYIDDTCRTLGAIADNFKPGRGYNISSSIYTDMKSCRISS